MANVLILGSRTRNDTVGTMHTYSCCAIEVFCYLGNNPLRQKPATLLLFGSFHARTGHQSRYL